MIPIAVFASGKGSNFEAIVRAIQERKLEADIRALVCDRPGAPVLSKAEAAGIPTILVPFPEKGGSREAHEKEILEKLERISPHFLVMAGYMRIITPRIIDRFRSPKGKGTTRIVNVHPSLLPAFPGMNAYAQAFESGAKVTGVTVHLVDEGVDSGPICAQESFSIADCQSAEEVESRGLAVEHRLYPETLRWVLPENFEWVESGEPPNVRRTCVRAR